MTTAKEYQPGYVRTNPAPVEDGSRGKLPPRTIEISKRAIVVAVVIVLVLVIAAIVVTQVLPKGSYERGTDAASPIPTPRTTPCPPCNGGRRFSRRFWC